MSRRRLDQLTRRIEIRAKSAAVMATGGQCHDDPAHVVAVMRGLIAVGAADVLRGRLADEGMTDDAIDELFEALQSDELSPIGVLPKQ